MNPLNTDNRIKSMIDKALIHSPELGFSKKVMRQLHFGKLSYRPLISGSLIWVISLLLVFSLAVGIMLKPEFEYISTIQEFLKNWSLNLPLPALIGIGVLALMVYAQIFLSLLSSNKRMT